MIPLAKDSREALGDYAQRVENRSLLFSKMVLSKSTLHTVDRFEDAQRFNVLRATHQGNLVLQEERDAAKNKATSLRAREDVKQKAAYTAQVAQALAGVKVDHADLSLARIESNKRFLLDLQVAYGDHASTFIATLGGRLLIHMAGGVMENSGMALDRITGLPMIPGSAVKGITRHQALWSIRREQDTAVKAQLLRYALSIFGFSNVDISRNGDFVWAANGDLELVKQASLGFTGEAYKGLCAFLAAQPNDIKNLNIVAEVLTPHFNNNLRPIFFPAVEAGSTFGFAIILQRESHLPDIQASKLLEQAKTWLQEALKDNGIGAKTGAGYGWFKIDPQAEEKRRAELQQVAEKRLLEKEGLKKRIEAAKAETMLRAQEDERKANLSPVEAEKEILLALSPEAFANYVKTLAEKNEDQQRALIAAFLSQDKKDTRKNWKKNKPNFIEQITQTAKALNIPIP